MKISRNFTNNEIKTPNSNLFDKYAKLHSNEFF